MGAEPHSTGAASGHHDPKHCNELWICPLSFGPVVDGICGGNTAGPAFSTVQVAVSLQNAGALARSVNVLRRPQNSWRAPDRRQMRTV